MAPLRSGLGKRARPAPDHVPSSAAADPHEDGEEVCVGVLDEVDSESESEVSLTHTHSNSDSDDSVLYEGEDGGSGEESSDGRLVRPSDDSEESEDEDGDSREEEGESGDEDSESENEDREEGASENKQGLSGDEEGESRDKQKNGEENRDEKVTQASLPDEYASGDSSDEEERVNTCGAVPRWWYRDYPHVGYDLHGRRILRPLARDTIDTFLQRCEDPEFWRTVQDPHTGQDVVLSESDLRLLAALRANRPPEPQHDDYKEWSEWFSRTVLATPVRSLPEHKRSFLPSQSDKQQVARLVHALKMGWIKTRREMAAERRLRKERRPYNLWEGDSEPTRTAPRHIPAPRRPLPSHAESYNPPPEYLLDEKEMKEWRKLERTPWKRKYTFLPMRHESLRAVGAFPRFVRERFLRCLDLYLAPRGVRMRLSISPQDLLPVLPSPRDLQPFPVTQVLELRGHEAAVRALDTDPSGQYVVSGGDDETVRVWEVSSGRQVARLEAGARVRSVAWCPSGALCLVAAAAGRRLVLFNPGERVGDARAAKRTDSLLAEPPPPAHDIVVEERVTSAVTWQTVDEAAWTSGVRLSLMHFKDVTHVQWHGRGDYMCVTLADAASRSVLVHQLSRRRSQLPFSKSKGLVQCALFHPVRPFLFVATQRTVRVYDLVKQEQVKKLLTGAQWISCMAIHPGGDNLLVASYDRKIMWFDLDLSAAPYQTLRLHGGAVRALAFHRRYPLFASGGDDLHTVVCHGRVFADLLQSALLVPLKRLAGHVECDGLGVLALAFHPAQPWLFSAGADATIRLYV